MPLTAILDASAVLALVRDEPGGEIVAERIGRAAISAVNLQEVVKELLASGIDEAVARSIVDELRLEIRPHAAEDAFAAARLHEATRRHGRGLGDRSCMALGLALDLPVLTADRDWFQIEIEGLKLERVR